eukprot:CAMPEP_0170490136 /NCGR_PEP_ID=MMETSP0208-20121228/8395_1 /TAXON_ID=197538 /ORGANISM="Strombidium inclinatum, Strain S3" /LENGTH=181 /DNA_ID=CAMNT_0010765393 /DNA_START=2383 /DNA_END=2930 /DNA_ORIENTATION=-
MGWVILSSPQSDPAEQGYQSLKPSGPELWIDLGKDLGRSRRSKARLESLGVIVAGAISATAVIGTIAAGTIATAISAARKPQEGLLTATDAATAQNRMKARALQEYLSDTPAHLFETFLARTEVGGLVAGADGVEEGNEADRLLTELDLDLINGLVHLCSYLLQFQADPLLLLLRKGGDGH